MEVTRQIGLALLLSWWLPSVFLTGFWSPAQEQRTAVDRSAPALRASVQPPGSLYLPTRAEAFSASITGLREVGMPPLGGVPVPAPLVLPPAGLPGVEEPGATGTAWHCERRSVGQPRAPNAAA